MLQGRTENNVASRFVQNFGIELRNAGTAVARHLTVTTTPASVRGCSSTCDPDMKFDKFSKKASSGPNAEFASDNTGATAAPLADLEPGTYDVYLKGRSSVAVLVTGVAFGPGNTKSITRPRPARGRPRHRWNDPYAERQCRPQRLPGVESKLQHGPNRRRCQAIRLQPVRLRGHPRFQPPRIELQWIKDTGTVFGRHRTGWGYRHRHGVALATHHHLAPWVPDRIGRHRHQ
ncbi:MAG: hypothetical protein EBT00_14950 [Proteobacteria bacterium]|nr:hypothetical protein [Pseudomonadota bacterium]